MSRESAMEMIECLQHERKKCAQADAAAVQRGGVRVEGIGGSKCAARAHRRAMADDGADDADLA